MAKFAGGVRVDSKKYLRLRRLRREPGGSRQSRAWGRVEQAAHVPQAESGGRAA